ncbi:hypothetical protein [Luteibacter sp.]|uniref:hypothetical protein n=1 Tax=Luteibacter sp. TaxID=1886636 RepID=UPI0025C5A6AA|nr:hypothetical protein [Luteibacter sp.]
MANAFSFAHLGGIGRGKASKAAEGDDEEKKDAKAKAEEEDEDDDKSAEGEEDDAKAEGDQPEKKDDEEKGAKAEGDDEDKDEEMRGNSASAQARRREQSRCAAIFASPAAARNPVLAANLAFKGRMPRREAIALLESTPAPAAAGYVGRAARNPQVGADGGAKPTPQQATAARWDQHLQSAAKVGRR